MGDPSSLTTMLSAMLTLAAHRVFLKLNQRLNILKTKYHNSQFVASFPLRQSGTGAGFL
jgi:hypothetical protein